MFDRRSLPDRPRTASGGRAASRGSGPSPAAALSRAPGEHLGSDSRDRIGRGRAAGDQPLPPASLAIGSLPPAARDALGGGGEPLAPDVRARMERSFGADFGSVRLHAGRHAAAGNLRLGSLGFAAGEHVALLPGLEGRDDVLGHELTHVVQQRRRASGAGGGGDPEREAHAAGRAVAAGRPVGDIAARPAAAVQFFRPLSAEQVAQAIGPTGPIQRQQSFDLIDYMLGYLKAGGKPGDDLPPGYITDSNHIVVFNQSGTGMPAGPLPIVENEELLLDARRRMAEVLAEHEASGAAHPTNSAEVRAEHANLYDAALRRARARPYSAEERTAWNLAQQAKGRRLIAALEADTSGLHVEAQALRGETVRIPIGVAPTLSDASAAGAGAGRGTVAAGPLFPATAGAGLSPKAATLAPPAPAAGLGRSGTLRLTPPQLGGGAGLPAPQLGGHLALAELDAALRMPSFKIGDASVSSNYFSYVQEYWIEQGRIGGPVPAGYSSASAGGRLRYLDTARHAPMPQVTSRRVLLEAKRIYDEGADARYVRTARAGAMTEEAVAAQRLGDIGDAIRQAEAKLGAPTAEEVLAEERFVQEAAAQVKASAPPAGAAPGRTPAATPAPAGPAGRVPTPPMRGAGATPVLPPRRAVPPTLVDAVGGGPAARVRVGAPPTLPMIGRPAGAPIPLASSGRMPGSLGVTAPDLPPLRTSATVVEAVGEVQAGARAVREALPTIAEAPAGAAMIPAPPARAPVASSVTGRMARAGRYAKSLGAPAVEMGMGVLRLLRGGVILVGAAQEAARTAEHHSDRGYGLPSTVIGTVGTFVAAVEGGVIDDGLAALELAAGGGSVMQAWERTGSGPVQHQAGEAYRALAEVSHQTAELRRFVPSLDR